MPLATEMPSDWRDAAPAPVARIKRHHAQDESEGSHQDRTESQPRAFHCGGENFEAAGFASLARHLHDKNRIFGRERDQQDQSDLNI